MSFDTTRSLLESAAMAVDLSFPVAFDSDPSPQSLPVWGTWSVVQGDTIPAIIGRGHVRGQGMLVLQMFVKEGGASAEFTRAGDIVADSLNCRELTATAAGCFHAVTLRTFGFGPNMTRDGYRQRNLVCNFQRDSYTLPGFGYITIAGIRVTIGSRPVTIYPP